MGRNTIPKLEEWRDGKLYRFRSTAKDPTFVSKDDGSFVVYEVLTAHHGEVPHHATCYQCGAKRPNWTTTRPCTKAFGHLWVTSETLGTGYADGLQDLMASMWESGHRRGVRDGRRERGNEIRKALEQD